MQKSVVIQVDDKPLEYQLSFCPQTVEELETQLKKDYQGAFIRIQTSHACHEVYGRDVQDIAPLKGTSTRRMFASYQRGQLCFWTTVVDPQCTPSYDEPLSPFLTGSSGYKVDINIYIRPEITVTLPDGRQLVTPVSLHTTGADLVATVAKKAGIAQSKLTLWYLGKENEKISSRSTLASQGLHPESKVVAVVSKGRLSRGVVTIVNATGGWRNGRCVELDMSVNGHMKISIVLKVLDQNLGMDPSILRLVNDGERLHPDRTFDEHKIRLRDCSHPCPERIDVFLEQCGGMFHATSGRADLVELSGGLQVQVPAAVAAAAAAAEKEIAAAVETAAAAEEAKMVPLEIVLPDYTTLKLEVNVKESIKSIKKRVELFILERDTNRAAEELAAIDIGEQDVDTLKTALRRAQTHLMAPLLS